MLKQIGFGTLTAIVTLGSAVASIAIAPAFSAPSTQPTTNPAPEVQFVPKAQVTLTGNRITITLTNKTNAAISYQAIGDTQIRTLPGRGTVTLQGLQVPTTLTFDRQDFGLLTVTPKQTAPGTIEVTLDATASLTADETTLRVEDNGSVFLY